MAERQVLSQHWLSAERLRLYPWALVVWYALVAWTFHSQAQGMALHGEPIGSDFIAYWTASDLALEGDPSKAYDQAAIAEVQRRMLPDRLAFAPWIYPPTFLLLVLPLALLPYLWSYLAFMAVTFTGCAWWCCAGSRRARPGSSCCWLSRAVSKWSSTARTVS